MSEKSIIINKYLDTNIKIPNMLISNIKLVGTTWLFAYLQLLNVVLKQNHFAHEIKNSNNYINHLGI